MIAGLAASLFALAAGPSDLERWRPPELVVADRVPTTSVSEIRSLAFKHLGRPYVMGGVGNPGIDCSGFTCRVFAEAGYAIPRVSRDQANAGTPVPLDQLAPGDLLFFVAEPGATRITHVGLYLGKGELIHASSGQGRVVVAALSGRWFQERLVSARRILASTSTEAYAREERPPAPGVPLAPARELVEHTGDDVLPIMLRLPAKRPAPSMGPELTDPDATSLGVRAAAVTEAGVLGITLVPEAMVRFESIALELAVAVPVRFEIGEKPTVGPIDRPGDAFRFLRSASLGLRGADLELRLGRTGDATLASGLVLDRLAPASEASGVPGLSVVRTPLSFFGGLRTPIAEGEVVIDDVVDPGIFGMGVRVPLGLDVIRLGGAVATDQRGGTREARRALTAVEGSIVWRILDDRRDTLELGGAAGFLRSLGEIGVGIGADALWERRFGRYKDSSLTLRGRFHRLQGPFLDGVFGPTYVDSRQEHLDALSRAGGRWSAAGEAALRIGRFAAGAGWTDSFGDGRVLLDRRLHALIELQGIALTDSWLLDLRAVYAARGVPGPRPSGANDVLHGGARLRFTSWFSAEVYLEEGDGLEGGAGVTVAWIP